MKFEATTPVKVAAGIAGVVVVLAVANYLAGVLLFLSYRQSPGHVGLFTILQAYLSVEDPAMHRRVTSLLLMSLLLCFAGAFGLWMTLRSDNSSKTLYGKARFATLKDIRKEKLDGPEGVVLGRFKDELLRLGGYEFVLLAAPTRTGKGVGFCVPNLLQFTGSAVVLDIKGENYNLTSEFRKRYLGNEIIYFNPFSAQTHRWNPLSYVSADPNFRANDLMALATIIYPVNEKDPFWSDAAKNLFIGLGLLVLETPELPPTLGEILRQGSGKGMAPDQYLRKVLALRASGDRPLSNACRDSLNRFLSSGEQAVNGVQATFTASLTPWANAVIDKATSGDDFDLRDVRRKKMTVYLNIPAGEILQAAPIIKLFFSQLINENVKELPEHNPALKYQCLVLLDEFTAMGKVDIIAKGVGYMAGYNMRLALVIQDKNQLEAVYGKEDAHNIVSNMGAVIYFTPTQISEAEEYSKMIGNDTVSTTSRQNSHSQLFSVKGEGGGSSTTEQYQSRAILLPQELLQMSKDLELVVRSGMPVIQAGKIRYFEDEYFNERYTAVPMHEVNVGGQRRKVPIPAALPAGDWGPYQEAVATSDFYAKALASQAAAPPAAAAGPSPAVVSPPPPVALPAPPAPPVPPAPASPARPATAAVSAALRGLPDEALPYDALHAALRQEVGPDALVAPISVAKAYVEGLATYFSEVAQHGQLTTDEPLLIVDLAPLGGEFAWKLLRALQAKFDESGDGLPPLHYLACAEDALHAQALEAHPYFASLVARRMFSAVPRDELLSRQEPLLSVNPVVVVAESFFGALPHTLVSFDGGQPFAARVTARPSDADGAQVSLQAEWSVLEPGGVSVLDRVLIGCSAALGARVRLPFAGADVLADIDRITARRYLLLAADQAVSREQSVRDGLLGPASTLPVPPPPLPANYHGLVQVMRALDAAVALDAGGEGVPDLLLAMAPVAGRRDALARISGELMGVRGAGAGQGLPKGAVAASAAQCLAVSRRAEHDPHVLLSMYDHLVGLDWGGADVPHAAWRLALEQAWRLCLPGKGQTIHTALAYLASQVGHFGLSRKAAQAGMLVIGENVRDLQIEALCALHGADHEAARRALARAEALAGGQADETQVQFSTALQRRIEGLAATPWFNASAASKLPRRLQQLAQHHAAGLWRQSVDTDLSAVIDRARWASPDDTLAWIGDARRDPGHVACAILHKDWGEIGAASVEARDDAGLLQVWIGAEHQGQGYGPSAATAVMSMARAAGVRHLFASARPADGRWRSTLARLGFEPVPETAAGNGKPEFFHLPDPDRADTDGAGPSVALSSLVRLLAAHPLANRPR